MRHAGSDEPVQTATAPGATCPGQRLLGPGQKHMAWSFTSGTSPRVLNRSLVAGGQAELGETGGSSGKAVGILEGLCWALPGMEPTCPLLRTGAGVSRGR